MKPVFRLTAQATRALPRWVLFAICIAYAAFGLFGRDPWKNDDAAGFGVMWTMARGSAHDWLLPNLVGKYLPAAGPFGYWPGALFIRIFGLWVDADNAARIATGALFCVTCAFVWYGAYLLGRRAEVQPFKYAFGGEPEPRDYGRTLADGALLILLACFGLLTGRSHETTPQLVQFTGVAMLLYGLARSIDKPVQGSLWWGAAMGIIALSSNLTLALALLCGTFALLAVAPAIRSRWLFLLGLPVALAMALLWPAAALLAFPDDASWFLDQWLRAGVNAFSGPLPDALAYAAKNLPLFTWPAWPLAIWAWFGWKGLRRAPHIAIALSVIGPLLLLIAIQHHQNNHLFMLLLPALAMLATFALPTLKRGAINAMDWFAVLSFTIFGAFLWLVWLASLTGFPAQLARNFARATPGFTAQFQPASFLCACAVTLGWFALARWRIARHPKALWRSVVLSSAGATLVWVLLMTLGLPAIDYSRTYRDVAQQIAQRLPDNYTCISPVRLGNAQIASFAWFGHMRFAFGEDCDVLLRQDDQDFSTPAAPRDFAWKKVWEGRRAADREERFRLYVRVDRSRVTPIRRHHWRFPPS